MGLFIVTSDVDNRDNRPVYFPLDVPGAESLRDLYDDFQQFGMVIGDRLKVEDRGENYVEQERDGILLNAKGFRWIQKMNKTRLQR